MGATANLELDDALREVEAKYVADNPKSLAQYQRACEVLPGGNTRSVLHYSPFPLTMTTGAGARLDDVDGHRYVDFLGEYTAGLYGHSNSTIAEAVKAALDSGIVLGAPSDHEVELATLIRDRFPSCEQVRFCNSGTEANLMALGLARGHTGREKVMVFDGGYHGGVLYFAHGASPVNAPFDTVVGTYNDLDGCVALIEAHCRDLAAVLIEPMMGSGGGIAADVEFLKALRDATARHGIVLIFDEVMTSRLSPAGLQGLVGVTPDLTTLGKYLGGGLTFGAFGGRADLISRFDPRREDAFPHAGTFNNNVLTMAAGACGLRDIFTPEVATELNARGDRLRTALNSIAAQHDVPAIVTGIGSILCMHFQRTPITEPAHTEATPASARALAHLYLLSQGVYTARRGFMSLSLALDEADYARLEAAFARLCDDWGPVLRRTS
ncbi:MAG: aspartate aminotransferase family protein [Gammaproteobacteria bacterium]|nr:aspartate aminotransferase family protein [Gammaproteobacteria bacterium]